MFATPTTERTQSRIYPRVVIMLATPTTESTQSRIHPRVVIMLATPTTESTRSRIYPRVVIRAEPGRVGRMIEGGLPGLGSRMKDLLSCGDSTRAAAAATAAVAAAGVAGLPGRLLPPPEALPKLCSIVRGLGRDARGEARTGSADAGLPAACSAGDAAGVAAGVSLWGRSVVRPGAVDDSWAGVGVAENGPAAPRPSERNPPGGAATCARIGDAAGVLAGDSEGGDCA
eukprot:1157789-Pelagomonas_calceolata.AAC.7